MFVEAGDITDALNHVRIVNLLTGQEVTNCEWADDEEGAYREIVILPDGSPAFAGNNFVKRIVLAPIKIEITPR
jgi:hypothetical protein